jgi:hypothetical protein
MTVHILNADCREALTELADESVHSEIKQPRSIAVDLRAKTCFLLEDGRSNRTVATTKQ